jgi:Flp pilus assembly pilin Flp
MISLKQLLDRLKTSKKGATAMEYTLIVTLICFVCVAALKRVGGGYARIYNNIANNV